MNKERIIDEEYSIRVPIHINGCVRIQETTEGILKLISLNDESQCL